MGTEKKRTGPEQKCYPCIRSDLLPMFPVAQPRAPSPEPEPRAYFNISAKNSTAR